MKKILKRIVIFLIGLRILSALTGSLIFGEGVKTFILVGLFLALFDYLIKPILKLLLFPINILTLGLFRGLIDTFGLYLASIVIPNFGVNSYHFPGLSSNGFSLPPISLSLFWTYVIASFVMGFLITVLNWIFK